jgi:hypothetical protein
MRTFCLHREKILVERDAKLGNLRKIAFARKVAIEHFTILDVKKL